MTGRHGLVVKLAHHSLLVSCLFDEADFIEGYAGMLLLKVGQGALHVQGCSGQQGLCCYSRGQHVWVHRGGGQASFLLIGMQGPHCCSRCLPCSQLREMQLEDTALQMQPGLEQYDEQQERRTERLQEHRHDIQYDAGLLLQAAAVFAEQESVALSSWKRAAPASCCCGCRAFNKSHNPHQLELLIAQLEVQ